MLNDKQLLESILFDDLRPTDYIDKESFSHHLKQIYKDLAETNKEKKHGVFFQRFSDFIPKCPVFILSKFFKSLLKEENKKKHYLSLKEFQAGLVTLKYGTYEEVARVVFNIFDFEKKGAINTEDIKLLISFFPLNENNKVPEYMYQMESLNELDQIIEETFKKEVSNINFEYFMNSIENKANIFVMVFCYLYLVIPVLDKDIILKHQNLEKSSEIPTTPNNVQSNFSSKSVKRLLFSPLSVFSPATIPKLRQRKNSQYEKEIKTNILDQLFINNNLFKKTINVREPNTPITNSLRTIGVKQIELSSTTSYDMADNSLNSTKDKSQKNSQKSTNSNIEDIKSLIRKSTIIECSKETSNVDIFTMAEREAENEVLADITDFDSGKSLNIKEHIKHEGELFKFKKEGGSLCINYFYVTIIGQSIYYYKDQYQKKEDYFDSTYLPGCFFRENDKEEIGSNYFYSFTLVLPNESRRFYHKEKEEIKTWIVRLREVLCYEDFFEKYHLGETIGKGEFGVIKVGFEKKSSEKVAIKILNKAKISKVEQLNLMRSEIAIMKHCKHPNVIKFIANYENSEFIFIVMEYLKSGTLNEYLSKNKFNLNEKMAASICYQITDALLYLHKYGIIHRDLKPDNILVKIRKDNNDSDKIIQDIIEIKLMDFGLSKILGNKETTNEGYGTVAFIAPEILQRLPYNYKVDIWSLGIIMYFIISGEIPFMPKSKNLDDLTLNICLKEPKFPKKFETISKELIELIKSCLKKKPDERMSIEEIVKHKWYKSLK